jgi:hypothetical protein
VPIFQHGVGQIPSNLKNVWKKFSAEILLGSGNFPHTLDACGSQPQVLKVFFQKIIHELSPKALARFPGQAVPTPG